jgi:hypothetical protein
LGHFDWLKSFWKAAAVVIKLFLIPISKP